MTAKTVKKILCFFFFSLNVDGGLSDLCGQHCSGEDYNGTGADMRESMIGPSVMTCTSKWPLCNTVYAA